MGWHWFKKAEWSYLVSKTNTQHLVPLAKQVVLILKDLKNVTGMGDFVFRNGHDPKKAMSAAAINAALQRMGYDTQKKLPGMVLEQWLELYFTKD